MTEAFTALTKQMYDGDERKLILDVRTRWNSTHAMIARAWGWRKACDAMANDENLVDLKLKLSHKEWNTMDNIQEMLEIFEHATMYMSQALNPTLPHVIPIYNLILDELEKFIQKPTKNLVCRNAMKEAKEKIEEYYKRQEQAAYAITTSKLPRYVGRRP